MSVIGDDEVIFTGLNGAECESFVRAVRKHAFAEGKARDPAYMADYASICMDGAALRWFEELDPDVQADWNKLRPALLAQYPPDRHGESQQSPSIDTPVASVPAAASAPPQPNNPVESPQVSKPASPLPSAFLPTPAAAPPPLLSVAAPPPPPPPLTVAVPPPPPPIVAAPASPTSTAPLSFKAKYPFIYDASSNQQSAQSPSYSVASSSRQAPPLPPLPFKQNSWSTTSSGASISPVISARPPPVAMPLTGRIIIISKSRSNQTRYVRAWLVKGAFECTTTQSKALLVRYLPSDEPTTLDLLNSDADENLLGVTWVWRKKQPIPEALSRRTTISGDLAAVRGVPVVSSTSSDQTGKSGSALWNMDDHGYLKATWSDYRSGQTYPLEFVCEDDYIFVVSHAETFIENRNSRTCKKARLLFELV